MDIELFSEKSNLVSQQELDRVKLLAYFYLKSVGQVEFSSGDVHRWFDELHFAKPNSSRLNKKIRNSSMFVRGSKQGLAKLHAKQIIELDNQFSDSIWTSQSNRLRTNKGMYIDPQRIKELDGVESKKFDLLKLVALCNEINLSYQHGCLLSIAMLNRAIIDHIPPIFGCKAFAEVSNNYAGAKSFKESMQRLNTSQRKISDHHLHTQARKSESLPTIRQVDFSQDVDVLLSEIIRILK